jgi:hypothetical protein
MPIKMLPASVLVALLGALATTALIARREESSE